MLRDTQGTSEYSYLEKPATQRYTVKSVSHFATLARNRDNSWVLLS
jgi:hypothetical protein